MRFKIYRSYQFSNWFFWFLNKIERLKGGWMCFETALIFIENCGPQFCATNFVALKKLRSFSDAFACEHFRCAQDVPFDMAKQIAQSAATILLEISLIRFAFFVLHNFYRENLCNLKDSPTASAIIAVLFSFLMLSESELESELARGYTLRIHTKDTHSVQSVHSCFHNNLRLSKVTGRCTFIIEFIEFISDGTLSLTFSPSLIVQGINCWLRSLFFFVCY